MIHDNVIENEYLIIYFTNNIRMSNDEIQLKVIQRQKTISKLLNYNNKMYFIPFTRTEAIECNAALPELSEVTTIIHRKVIFSENTSEYNIRIALEVSTDKRGRSYTLTGEVEYGQNSAHYYYQNKKIEDQFFQVFSERCMYYLEDLKSKDVFQFSPNHIMGYGSRVFRPLKESCSITDEEKISFKFDGYKCKVAVKDGVLTFYDPKHNYFSGYCPALNAFENVVFQGEILGTSDMYLVDILGGFVNKKHKLYMPEPLEVFEFFKWFREYINEIGLSEPFKLVLVNPDGSKKIFNVRTQFVIDGEHTTTPFPTDGFIVTIRSSVIKFKIPTLEVVIEGGYMKVGDMVAPITDQVFPELLEGVIYEVQQQPDRTYKVLKIRYDKQVPSTEKEYRESLEELEFLRKSILASSTEEGRNRLKMIQNAINKNKNKNKN
ncbi:LEF-4 [Callinectes sapidus nudivirus]|nr:LEF-4 [Callinectes sapidus nudivirus]